MVYSKCVNYKGLTLALSFKTVKIILIIALEKKPKRIPQNIT